MSCRIFKYIVPANGPIELPAEAQILTVAMQQERMMMWALVDDEAPKEERRFIVFGTGEVIPRGNFQWIATVQDGNFVWHLFEIKLVRP